MWEVWGKGGMRKRQFDGQSETMTVEIKPIQLTTLQCHQCTLMQLLVVPRKIWAAIYTEID